METLADVMERHLNDPLYNLVSMRKASIPTPGSECAPIRLFDLSKCAEVPLTRTITHRNGDHTAITAVGYFRFWREPSTNAS